MPERISTVNGAKDIQRIVAVDCGDCPYVGGCVVGGCLKEPDPDSNGQKKPRTELEGPEQYRYDEVVVPDTAAALGFVAMDMLTVV